MVFFISLVCFSILKFLAIALGAFSALCESISWAFDRLDDILFQSQAKLEAHADRYIVREQVPAIRQNKRRA